MKMKRAIIWLIRNLALISVLWVMFYFAKVPQNLELWRVVIVGAMLVPIKHLL